ncbi:N,N-dimethylformamidase beta subunit family domain-containing protein [Acuticoccus sp. I52.16.1]|uniref:N,N-dimethylformamidase beta subunit family domain-containing protein n=1 Tax=Acuticoccus sp. I52.16.1 TaxID=2928472 RepID=UPI001FD143F9|nr:N,N-dimethylformamidase beta subunit family domain-containing protein [Acuticoccus sp. I52.16.1]UOM36492.1 N,N-dimethylformamidase [Acuticoccus sp. I52.16.1]
MLALTGYIDRLSARPGEEIAFKLSSTGTAPVDVRLVRVVSADPNPGGPGIIEHDLADVFTTSVPSRVQTHTVGSSGYAPLPPMPEGAITLTAVIWPTSPRKGEQGILAALAGQGLALTVGEDGCVNAVLRGDGDLGVSSGAPLSAHNWYRVWASWDPAAGTLTVGQHALIPPFGPEPPVVASVSGEVGAVVWPEVVTFAALAGAPASAHYNGKIEAPAILAGAYDAPPEDVAAIAAWDFSRQISSTTLEDTGPHGCHGTLVNLPARAMTGSNWVPEEMHWVVAPERYGAIHFHDTDLADCGWDTDFTFTVPQDLRSGVYAMRMRCGAEEDTIPFYVVPPRGTRTANLCVLVPTFTYVVYQNFARPDFGPAFRERAAALGGPTYFPGDHPEYAHSTYNLHSDGAGVCHSSHLRPFLTMRPGHLSYLDYRGSGLRHYSADSHLFYFLESEGIAYDVVTDHELDAEGHDVIAGYECVTTTSHPEYHTEATLDALLAYRNEGGRFCYLGGNGFYWRVARHPEVPEAIEIRRGEGGIRAWAAEPGEYYNAFDGAYGGLWRRSGRPPQALAGVGFSSQGPLDGAPYRILPAARDPRAAWIFEGVDQELIGDAGLSGGGAAGFELDRADVRLGTPEHTLILARSEGHSEKFIVVHEEMLTHLTTVPQEPAPALVRAEIVFFETPKGGAVFSTGSITFCGSLPDKGGEPGTARMLANVFRRFSDPAPFQMP